MAADDPALTRAPVARVTHVILRDDHDRPVGRALCGRLVSITVHAPASGPTCVECAAALRGGPA